jgi:hypothetical protein
MILLMVIRDCKKLVNNIACYNVPDVWRVFYLFGSHKNLMSEIK